MRKLSIDYCIAMWHRWMAENRVPSFSRFGDGEFACMLGSGPSNCDRHPYTRELQKDLVEAFIHPRKGVQYGVQRMVMEQRMAEGGMLYLLNERGLNEGDSDEYTLTMGDVFHHMSMRRQLEPVLKYLQRKQALFVGPSHLKEMKGVTHTVIPSLNCYAEKESIKAQIKHHYKNWARVFALSCSMLSEVLIHELQPEMPDAIFLDCGSVWDPYCGVQSRTYHKQYTTQEWRGMLYG